MDFGEINMPFSLWYIVILAGVIILMIFGMRVVHNMLRSLNNHLVNINNIFEGQFIQYKIFHRDVFKYMGNSTYTPTEHIADTHFSEWKYMEDDDG